MSNWTTSRVTISLSGLPEFISFFDLDYIFWLRDPFTSAASIWGIKLKKDNWSFCSSPSITPLIVKSLLRAGFTSTSDPTLPSFGFEAVMAGVDDLTES